MLDQSMTDKLRQYLANLRDPIELVASLGDDARSAQLRELLEQIAALHGDIALRFDGEDARRPSFEIRRASEPARSVRFAGVPLGHEFNSLVLALLWAGGHPPKVDADLLEQVRGLEGDYAFEMYFSLSCHNCPDVVQALTLMALENPRISATLIEGGAFQGEVEQRGVLAVPATFLNGESFYNGKMELAEILRRLDSSADARAAQQFDSRPPFEVLVLGSGPAGVSSAIYTARKGFSTALVGERFGGQLQDTLGIENLPGTTYTEGPKLAGEMQRHVGEYDIDVINSAKATRLVAAERAGGLHKLEFANGGSLQARAVILAPGARWRQLGVPGEEEYRNKGVAYCPHCDGPLFKGKQVAVIGGGNSGVEAAIDLANIVRHVTLIEYDSKLRADEVLQAKLRSLANVDVITSAQTTEIAGADDRVNGLVYIDRESGEEHRLALQGVFVQIGLVPNTEWLKDSGIELNRFGEIVTDDHGATSLPGVFAAGDATCVPYKQIVVAMGEGSKAGLSAFDYLIRNAAEQDVAEAA